MLKKLFGVREHWKSFQNNKSERALPSPLLGHYDSIATSEHLT